MDSCDPGLRSQNKCNTQWYRHHLDSLAWSDEDEECKTYGAISASPWIISNIEQVCQGQVREPRLAWELEEPAFAGGCRRLIYQQHKLSVGTTNRGQGEKQAFVNQGGNRGQREATRCLKGCRSHSATATAWSGNMLCHYRGSHIFFPLNLHDCKETPEGFAWGSHQVKGEQPWAQVTAAWNELLPEMPFFQKCVASRNAKKG